MPSEEEEKKSQYEVDRELEKEQKTAKEQAEDTETERREKALQALREREKQYTKNAAKAKILAKKRFDYYEDVNDSIQLRHITIRNLREDYHSLKTLIDESDCDSYDYDLATKTLEAEYQALEILEKHSLYETFGAPRHALREHLVELEKTYKDITSIPSSDGEAYLRIVEERNKEKIEKIAGKFILLYGYDIDGYDQAIETIESESLKRDLNKAFKEKQKKDMNARAEAMLAKIQAEEAAKQSFENRVMWMTGLFWLWRAFLIFILLRKVVSIAAKNREVLQEELRYAAYKFVDDPREFFAVLWSWLDNGYVLRNTFVLVLLDLFVVYTWFPLAFMSKRTHFELECWYCSLFGIDWEKKCLL